MVDHSNFAVAITPEFTESGEWTGNVSAHLEEEVLDDLTTDELSQLRSVTGMLASCLMLLEVDEDFREYVKEFFVNNQTEMIEEFVKDIEKREATAFTRSEDGKVITLDFNTKTFGNA